MSKCETYLDAASKNLEIAMEYLDIARHRIDMAFGGYDPGYPTPDSFDSMAWDYLDAITIAEREIGNRLNTWNEGDYSE